MAERSPPRDDPYAALAWMALAAVSFAAMNATARGLRALPWPALAFSRALFGLCASVLIARLRGASLAVRDRKVMWKRSLFGSGGMLCTFYALTHMPLADATALLNTTPLWIAAFAFLSLGERVSRAVLVALMVALAGVFMIEHPGAAGGHFAGLVALGAGACGAMAMVSLRRLSGETPEAVVVHFSAIASGVMATAWAVQFSSSRALPVVHGREALAIAVMGLTATLGQLSLTRAYALDKAARVGAAGWLQVLVALLIDGVFFGHLPDTLATAGIVCLVIAGSLLISDARASVRQRVAER